MFYFIFSSLTLQNTGAAMMRFLKYLCMNGSVVRRQMKKICENMYKVRSYFFQIKCENTLKGKIKGQRMLVPSLNHCLSLT